MNKKQILKMVKKSTAGVLAVGMILAGVAFYPKQADAAIVGDKVIYEEYLANDISSNYWNAEKKVAPVKEGYVFGGWFEQVTEQTEKTEADTEGNYYSPLTTVSGAAYAKFVPAQVLSVKAQNGVEEGSKISKIDKTTINDISPTNPMYVRVMSSLDSANYKKVGFEIYLANWLKVYKDGTALTTKTKEATETTKIYRGLLEDGVTKTANSIFGGESEYLSVWKLSAIDTPGNAKLIIYVRPYWETMDGTQVNGLAKYVHIEDDYLGYINVPINLLGGEKVAAGAIDMTYTSQTSASLTLVEFEKGRIFEKMNHSYTGNTVKMVGDTDLEVGKYDENGETLYANLRFVKPTEDTAFNIVDDIDKFCNWEEEFVDVKKVWDIKYVQTTTN